jgi:hypothetical protein
MKCVFCVYFFDCLIYQVANATVDTMQDSENLYSKVTGKNPKPSKLKLLSSFVFGARYTANVKWMRLSQVTLPLV